ncbi:MAG: hypothetical protein ACKN92_02190 [Candidatus Nanopelagicaceae bacterium]
MLQAMLFLENIGCQICVSIVALNPQAGNAIGKTTGALVALPQAACAQASILFPDENCLSSADPKGSLIVEPALVLVSVTTLTYLGYVLPIS